MTECLIISKNTSGSDLPGSKLGGLTLSASSIGRLPHASKQTITTADQYMAGLSQLSQSQKTPTLATTL